ncbi:hypothetical protein SCHPADRAFT_941557 [Schizopora paradoxa]|uniref:Uncharacterized protein n=1 Tax=Schizopora paradoxa TaxID=27342 RepID=A0A0H2RJ95_9AGAM|nr:hypothetical protein SCHPADRAFT_941557 [Schizopora paradoxa]
MATAATATAAAAVSRTFSFFWNNAIQHPPEPQVRDGEVTVFLQPRRFARFAGVFTLVPLLPKRPPTKQLPTEVWRRILSILIDEGEEDDGPIISKAWLGRPTAGGNSLATSEERSHNATFKWNLALVSKEFKDIALPILYAHCHIASLNSLRLFVTHLSTSDQKWDSIRRIPYSSPGRWVQSLDVSRLTTSTHQERFTADDLLTRVFPLLPFLSRLELSLTLQLSRRAMHVLGTREGAASLRSLKGVKYDSYAAAPQEPSGHRQRTFVPNDPLTELIRNCPSLEELEVVGLGLDDLDVMIAEDNIMARNELLNSHSPTSLHLPNLRSLTLLSTPTSDLLLRLIHAQLPSLTNLIITPYGDIPSPLSLITPFLAAHGSKLRTLVLFTPKSWPTVIYPPPSDLLLLAPNLLALSLEKVRLSLNPPPPPPLTAKGTPVPGTGHPLKELWIALPTVDLREAVVTLLPVLPNLRRVRARETRWAKKGMSARALEAGYQGEMRSWRRVLARFKVRMLDADGRESGL